MDSENYMYDANDSDLYDSDSEGYAIEHDYDDVAENGSDDDSRRPVYTILSDEDILQRQKEAITAVSALLYLSEIEAGILLRHFKWSVTKVHDEWFANEEKVRMDVGLLEKPAHVEVRPDEQELTCGICFNGYLHSIMTAAACGHHFCNECWTGYIHTSIDDGPGCLTLRCPNLSCSAAVDEGMVFSLVSDEDRAKYTRYLLRSYVEDKRNTKWCPAPGCEYGVEFVMASGHYDVKCKCGYNFCWNCCEEAHRPVDCHTVEMWILKTQSESKNWILANSKPCPKCKRRIEKNEGCMHMTCTPPCRFEFCWFCLADWSEHRQGGIYECNRYETADQEGNIHELEREREKARNSLERYTHYYERWATNESSRQKALSDLQQMQTVQIEKLSDRLSKLPSQLKFVTDAWLQIVECRRVLKWTYAYGYYLQHDKRQFFEYLQGEAQSSLERLHSCAEKELQSYIDGESLPKDFNEHFRPKLVDLTKAARNYFENLVQALENGLSDVNNRQAGVEGSSSKASPNSNGREISKSVTSEISSSSWNTDDNSH